MYSTICLPVCLPSFVRSLPSFVRYLPFSVRFSLSHRTTISIPPFPSLEHFCPSPFVIILPLPSLQYYPLPIVRAQLFILFRYSSATLSTTFRSVFSSILSPSSSQFFLSIFLPPFVPLASSFFAPLLLATYPLDYLVLGTGYSVLRTRYSVYNLATTIEHTATERRHPEATAFVLFVLVRLLLPLQASWGILRLFVSVSRRRNAWDQDTASSRTLPSLLLFLLSILTSLPHVFYFFFFVLSSPRSLVTRILLLASVYPPPLRRAGP